MAQYTQEFCFHWGNKVSNNTWPVAFNYDTSKLTFENSTMQQTYRNMQAMLPFDCMGDAAGTYSAATVSKFSLGTPSSLFFLESDLVTFASTKECMEVASRVSKDIWYEACIGFNGVSCSVNTCSASYGTGSTNPNLYDYVIGRKCWEKAVNDAGPTAQEVCARGYQYYTNDYTAITGDREMKRYSSATNFPCYDQSLAFDINSWPEPKYMGYSEYDYGGNAWRNSRLAARDTRRGVMARHDTALASDHYGSACTARVQACQGKETCSLGR